MQKSLGFPFCACTFVMKHVGDFLGSTHPIMIKAAMKILPVIGVVTEAHHCIELIRDVVRAHECLLELHHPIGKARK